ncbi:hypothetical protein DERF_006028 [Dermatophagoides farinae]|uniref:Uncharacterized protein n=1 Tax=Dermatophagoides farinae TaxID=6954 RepID=A0A922L791_DERFA|nr:hypothetical protein DERF_006028 [Dermatophagoides farinae]
MKQKICNNNYLLIQNLEIHSMIQVYLLKISIVNFVCLEQMETSKTNERNKENAIKKYTAHNSHRCDDDGYRI